ncbi:reverse transcriptase domain-containing protein [Tanacetum coccineum]
MESVFYISKCTVECQVKFATCTLLGGALTWWNSHVRTVEHDAAYLLPWKTLMKMMTENYCLRSELKKLETELWNLVVKGTDIESYTQRFQKIILLCSRMVSDESDKVEKYIGGLPNRHIKNHQAHEKSDTHKAWAECLCQMGREEQRPTPRDPTAYLVSTYVKSLQCLQGANMRGSFDPFGE